MYFFNRHKLLTRKWPSEAQSSQLLPLLKGTVWNVKKIKSSYCRVLCVSQFPIYIVMLWPGTLALVCKAKWNTVDSFKSWPKSQSFTQLLLNPFPKKLNSLNCNRVEVQEYYALASLLIAWKKCENSEPEATFVGVLLHLYQYHHGKSKLLIWLINRKKHREYTVNNRVPRKKSPLSKWGWSCIFHLSFWKFPLFITEYSGRKRLHPLAA